MSRGSNRGVLRRWLAPAAIGVAALVAASSASTASAYVPTGSDFRISNVFTDGDAGRVGTESAVAYNSSSNEYLVVFRADAGTDDEFEIYARRVSAAGAPLASDFRISEVGDDGDASRDAETPAVAYNPTSNQYLVVWSGDTLPLDEEHEIYGQRVSAGGIPDPQGDFRISNVDPAGPDRDAEHPAVVADPESGRFLVSWEADDLVTDDRFEIFARLISAAGVPDPAGDFRVSNGGPDGMQIFDAVKSAISFNPADDEFLVVWQGEALPTEGVAEVWAQRVSAAGVPDVQGDFRVSDVGLDDDEARDGLAPAVAYNAVNNGYLVVWRDDGYELAQNDEFEVFGQRLSAIGDQQEEDFRLSAVGADGDATRAAGSPTSGPAVAFNGANEYLVAWHGDGLATDNEFEVFTQRLNANGDQIGGDTRVSSAGADGDDDRHAQDPALAFGSGSNQYLATWTADDLPTNDEDEIFGRRLAPTPPTAAAPPPPPPRAYELPKKKCKKKKKKKGKALAATAKKKKKKKKC